MTFKLSETALQHVVSLFHDRLEAVWPLSILLGISKDCQPRAQCTRVPGINAASSHGHHPSHWSHPLIPPQDSHPRAVE